MGVYIYTYVFHFNDVSNFLQEGSQVYRFDAELGTLTLVQQLTDLDVYSVHYFHEKQENRHYIIMNNGLEPKLYRWSSA